MQNADMVIKRACTINRMQIERNAKHISEIREFIYFLCLTYCRQFALKKLIKIRI